MTLKFGACDKERDETLTQLYHDIIENSKKKTPSPGLGGLTCRTTRKTAKHMLPTLLVIQRPLNEYC